MFLPYILYKNSEGAQMVCPKCNNGKEKEK